MRTMSIPVLVMCLAGALGGSTVPAQAGKPEVEHGPTVVVPAPASAARTVGDDCSNPIVVSGLPFVDLGRTTCGRGNDYETTCLDRYDGGEDIVYRLDLASPTPVRIAMDPHATMWTGLAIFAGCPATGTCLARSTGSTASPRVISALELAAGTYYIMVDTWPAPTCIPSFDLSITYPVTFANPICELAIDIQQQGLTSFPVYTCGALPDYSPTNGCTGFAAPGEDAVWKIHLLAGQTLAATLTGEDYDASLYVLTDCADMNSCVAGGDDPETFSYVATAAGWYYVVVDGYLAGACGSAVLTIAAPVAAEPTSWGDVKAWYR